MGLLIGGHINVVVGGPFVIVTDFSTFESLAGTPVAVSGARYNSDGSIDEIEGRDFSETYTQIHTGEWWSDEPDSGIGSDYDIRCQSIDANGPWDTQPASVGTYVGLNTNPIWRVQAAGGKSGPNNKLITATMQIRLGVSPFTLLVTFEQVSQANRHTN